MLQFLGGLVVGVVGTIATLALTDFYKWLLQPRLARRFSPEPIVVQGRELWLEELLGRRCWPGARGATSSEPAAGRRRDGHGA